MREDLRHQVIDRLRRDYGLAHRTGTDYMRGGKCPACGKKELYNSHQKPWVVRHNAIAAFHGRIASVGKSEPRWEAAELEAYARRLAAGISAERSIASGWRSTSLPLRGIPDVVAEVLLRAGVFSDALVPGLGHTPDKST